MQSAVNITEEKLKKELDCNNQKLYTTLNHYSGLKKEFHIKKIDALNEFWQAFIELKEAIPSSLSLILSVLKKNEFNYDFISKNRQIFDVIKHQFGSSILSSECFDKFAKISKPIELIRYFVRKDLHHIWSSYKLIVGQVVLNFSAGLKSQNITHWKDNQTIGKNLLYT